MKRRGFLKSVIGVATAATVVKPEPVLTVDVPPLPLNGPLIVSGAYKALDPKSCPFVIVPNHD